MIEVTVHHKSDPELIAALNAIAVSCGRIGITIPPALFEPVKAPEEKLPARRGRPSKQGDLPAPPAPPAESEAGILPDYDNLKSKLRDLMSKGMAQDVQHKDRANRDAMKQIFIGLYPDSDGKMSQLPDEYLEQAIALVDQLVNK
jgi:hypothetical protein